MQYITFLSSKAAVMQAIMDGDTSKLARGSSFREKKRIVM